MCKACAIVVIGPAKDRARRKESAMPHLFASVDEETFDAVDVVSTLSGLSKRSIMVALVAEKRGVADPNLSRVRSAWARYRKGDRP